MKSSRTLKLAGALLGATIMTSTVAIASGSNGKCGTGTCGAKNSTEKVNKKVLVTANVVQELVALLRKR